MKPQSVLNFEVLDGNGNATAFEHFMNDLANASDQSLLPHDSIIVIDNVRFHHHARVQEMMETRGW